MNKLEAAFQLFDDYNRQDPKTIVWNGESYPEEYFYALQLHNWVTRLEPQPSEPLLLASRCQHIGRWEVPRNTYPAGKPGYYKWRTDLGRYHAEKAGELMAKAGYDEETIGQVQRIVRKEDLRNNHDVQVIENALCLVFLQFQYDDFIKEHEDDKVIRILQKTWNKMTGPGREAATKLSFGERGTALLQQALAGK